ncbi:RNI-like superfamily protein [Hibiscus syriacus]|uniref:RNI-like superfamily protein n=1 Tax=Hibiscus syriacus TaxID=106335 RepID=A0A6A2XQ30_HIBSY|nr:RNI-like superfamily protein [Hibiscus syriacus]
MKNQILEQVIGVPMKSTIYGVELTQKRYLPNTAGQYYIPSVEGANALIKTKGNFVLKRMKKLGKKADTFAHGVREHARLGPKISETVQKKLSLAVAFCSDRSIKIPSPNGEFLGVHYKVMIPVEKIKGVNESESMKKPSQKYMEIVTVDDFEFWFMGFLNHQKVFKYLQQEGGNLASCQQWIVEGEPTIGQSILRLLSLLPRDLALLALFPTLSFFKQCFSFVRKAFVLYCLSLWLDSPDGVYFPQELFNLVSFEEPQVFHFFYRSTRSSLVPSIAGLRRSGGQALERGLSLEQSWWWS